MLYLPPPQLTSPVHLAHPLLCYPNHLIIVSIWQRCVQPTCVPHNQRVGHVVGPTHHYNYYNY